MSNASKFRKLPSDAKTVPVVFDGEQLQLAEGENLAAALLNAGVAHFRETPVSGAKRAPYCMMGACYECLVEIDGISMQACVVEVREGLTINRLEAYAERTDA